MKKIIIAVLAVLAAAAVIFYLGKDKINIVNSDNGEQNEINLKENLQKVGKKIMKKADEKIDEVGQILKDEQKYHEQLKNEANRDVKIFEPIYKDEKNSQNSKKNQNSQNSVQISGENSQNSPNSGQQKSQNPNPQNKKKIEIELN